MKPNQTRYLHTIKEAAELLGVGRTTMYDLLNSGLLRVTKIGTRGIRISDDELKRYIAENSESR
ncbi:helix-turn-helix domain-containing protein [Coleofasciculus sp. LEGE 07081]|uniref:helix-turn-helix transcriptional regulator n=1 Tax=Coleofasciculus sp. LEGE 07081 TaxID=2777967 RepID=UPI001880B3E1|nr:helix-turn-helix domain-containing protein [Coleofasciculus sp. LEGE 07081]